MPQHNQHCLIHILLLWTTILSIIQIVFMAFFFTAGHHGLSQNSSAVAPQHKKQIQENITPLAPSEQGVLLGKGKMLSFTASEDGNKIKWQSKDLGGDLVSQNEKGLTIKKDGYYFLNLQVTFSSCSQNPTHRVSLEYNNQVLLQCSIKSPGSTGTLSKVEELVAGGTLVVTISPPTMCLNNTNSLTHLDIIYMVRP